jgi:hypothetical protein
MAVVQTGWSGDGNWFWDGAKWNDAISQDGQWKFDGVNWQPFAGVRTTMPALPFGRSAVSSVAASMPSWVAESEIQRLESQKIEQRLAEMTPAAPLPPDRDWRRVGEFMTYSKSAPGSMPTFWKSGIMSLFIYLGLLWLCSPLALVYVWLTEWRMYTKVYRTAISLVWTIAVFDYISTHYSL